jgi:hypothetical protein
MGRAADFCRHFPPCSLRLREQRSGCHKRHGLASVQVLGFPLRWSYGQGVRAVETRGVRNDSADR